MQAFVDSTELNERMKNYFNVLRSVGYVKGSTVNTYLVYLFLYDFVDTLFYYMSEDDYNRISCLLQYYLVYHGNCLLPYKHFCEIKAKIGSPVIMGKPEYRRMEDIDRNRKAEDSTLRSVDYGNV